MTRRARYLWPLLFSWALLGASECSESSINADINAVLGIDTDSPAQVGAAVLLGQTFGNEEEQRAAEMGSTLKDFRRADHEQKGDRAWSGNDDAGAAREYRTALRWVGSGASQENVRADLNVKLADALFRDGEGKSVAKYREAADLYAAARRHRERDPQWQKSRGLAGLYEQEAQASFVAGDYSRSCNARREAAKRGQPETWLAAEYRAKGINCTA